MVGLGNSCFTDFLSLSCDPNLLLIKIVATLILSSGCYEVDDYVYSAAEEPKIMMTGKWNEKISYQPCVAEGEPLPGTEL